MGSKPRMRRRSVDSAATPVILYTLGSLEIGGSELRALELLTALRAERAGPPPIVFVACRPSGSLEAEFRALGVPIVFGGSGPRGMVSLWWTCVRSDASILHSNADTLSGFQCLAAALAGVRVRIAHFHTVSVPDHTLYQRAIARANRTLVRLCSTKTIGVCDAARPLSGASEAQWQTVHNGIACGESAAPEPRPPRQLVFLGRIHPEKGYLKAVDIFDALMAHGSPAALSFVGTGHPDQMARLRERVAASPFRDAIVIHGASREPRRHLRRACALLLPSAREGLPAAVIEALSEGVPVIASDLPGLREIERVSTGVRLVSVDAPAAAWVEAIETTLAEGPSRAISDRFRAGPFVFDRYLRSIKRLWGLTPADERA